MVYCGRPSKGCRSCRVRRIKVINSSSLLTVQSLAQACRLPNYLQCDQIHPSCTQCIRVDKLCEGYRNQQDLMFRNETTKVHQKAKIPTYHIQEDKSSLVPVENLNTSELTDIKIVSVSLYACHLSSNHLVLTSLEERGVVFFFTHYTTSTFFSPRGAINYCDSPLWPRIHNNRELLHVVVAVGLAGLSSVIKDRDVMATARQLYISTVRHVAENLKNIDKDRLDDTMEQVMLLAIFEVKSNLLICIRVANSILSWSTGHRKQSKHGVFTSMVRRPF